ICSISVIPAIRVTSMYFIFKSILLLRKKVQIYIRLSYVFYKLINTPSHQAQLGIIKSFHSTGLVSQEWNGGTILCSFCSSVFRVYVIENQVLFCF
uniref:Uncharacterized protein n=1 Tax=Melopsittacus undulatus TaxID=13146 RepID=A0A8C6JN10_MELUD